MRGRLHGGNLGYDIVFNGFASFSDDLPEFHHFVGHHTPTAGTLRNMTYIEVPNSSPRRRRAGRGMTILIGVLLLTAGGLALWTWLALSWSYSDGERAGVLQKFSRRGWLCKTQEGELAMYIVSGIAPQVWNFTVRDQATAAALDKAVGHRVQLHYTEHPGIPSTCFGDTRYFVDRITIEDQAPNPAAPPASAR
jgi:hypothetical protein